VLNPPMSILLWDRRSWVHQAIGCRVEHSDSLTPTPRRPIDPDIPTERSNFDLLTNSRNLIVDCLLNPRV